MTYKLTHLRQISWIIWCFFNKNSSLYWWHDACFIWLWVEKLV